MKDDIKQINSYLIKVKDVINHIFNIINKYRFALKEEENVVRINQKYDYDNHLLRQTLRETKFFKRVNGEYKLEFLYTYNLIDNIDTYENRFIKYLVKNITSNLNILHKVFKPLNLQQVLNGRLTFTYYGNYKNLSYLENCLNTKDINILLNNLLNSLYLIRQTSFYKNIKDSSFNDVYVTNILNEDPNYNYCYKFYLIKVNYYPEFINKLLIDLRKNTILITDTEIDENNNFNNYIINYDNFILTLNSLNNNLNLSININDITHNYNITFDNFSTLPILKINNINIPLLFVKDYSLIILSLTYHTINNGYCPYCGAELTNNKCNNCGLEYEKYNKDGKEYLWLLNLLELPLGGE